MRRDFGPCVYIMAPRCNGTLYTGVTSDLLGRVYQHREGVMPGFTSKHGVKRLVWFAAFDDGIGDQAREADQEVAAPREARTD